MPLTTQDLEWSKKAQSATRLISESIERLSEKNPSHAYEARKWKGVIEREYDPIVKNLQAMEDLEREKLEQYDAKLRQLQEREILQGEREAQLIEKEQAAILTASEAEEVAASSNEIKKTIRSKIKELDALKQRCMEYTNQCTTAINTRLNATDHLQSLKAQCSTLEGVMVEEHGKLDQRKSDLDSFKQDLETRESALAQAKTLLESQIQDLRQEKQGFEKERQSFRDQEAESRGLVMMAIEYKRLKDQDIEAITSKVPSLEQDNKRLLEEEKRLKAANEDLLSKTRELENTVKILNTESMDRADSISGLQDRLAQLNNATEKAQQTCKEEHTGIDHLRQQLYDIKSERNEILEKGKRLQDVSNEEAKSLKIFYSKALEASQRDRDRLEESLNLCQEKLDNYMEEHAILVEKNHALEEKYQNGQAQYMDRRGELQESLDNSNEEIGRLTDELNQALETSKTLDTKLADVRGKAHDLEESLAEVQEGYSQVSQELHTSNESLESVREEHISALQELQAANQNLETLRKEHAHVLQRLRTANQSLESYSSNGPNHSRKRTHMQTQESERGGSSHSRTSREPRNEDRQRSGNVHLDISRQQNDVHPDGRSLTDSTGPRSSPLGGPTITRSEGGGFSMLVSEVERNNCTSDIIPEQVLTIIRQQIGEWTNRDANWTKTVSGRCVDSRIRHRKTVWVADGVGYACSYCKTNGHVCSLVEKEGILRFLPVKTLGETTKAPDEVDYWVELKD